MSVSKEQVVELMRPAMYWVGQMQSELHMASKGHIFTTTRGMSVDPQYREDMVELFGEELVERIGASDKEPLVTYIDAVDVVRSTLCLNFENEIGITDRLEDVMFYACEVWWSMERVREIIVKMGYEGDLDELINELGQEFVGTK